MSELLDGWEAMVTEGGEVILYKHEDDSLIAKLDEPYHGPLRGKWALYVGDPPQSVAGEYRTVEEAMHEHEERDR